MENMKFAVKFDKTIDTDKKLITAKKFLTSFFFKVLDEELEHVYNFDKKFTINHKDSKKFYYDEALVTALNLHQNLKKAKYKELDNNVVEVSFTFDYKIPADCVLYKDSTSYFKSIIDYKKAQNEGMLSAFKNMGFGGTNRAIVLQEYFNTMLDEMKTSLERL